MGCTPTFMWGDTMPSTVSPRAACGWGVRSANHLPRNGEDAWLLGGTDRITAEYYLGNVVDVVYRDTTDHLAQSPAKLETEDSR
jgi:hypothetical protein